MSYVQPDLIAWWYKGYYYRDLQMAQCVQLGFLTQQEHDEIKDLNGWWGGYRYVKQDPQRERPDSVPPLPELFSASAQSTDSATKSEITGEAADTEVTDETQTTVEELGTAETVNDRE